MYNIILVFTTNKIAIQEKKQLLAKTGEWIFYQTMKVNPDISERFAEKVKTKYNDLSLVQRIQTKVLQNKN